MNPLLWTTQFMVNELRYNASLKKNGDRTMERAADRLEELQKERDEARAELAQLRAERDLAQQLGRDEATVNQELTVRPEPSRLEIAAMVLTGSYGNSGSYQDLAKIGLKQADALIAAAKEVQ